MNPKPSPHGKLMTPAQVIGHRGAAACAPENTMPSFDLAARQGAGCVEHDLQVTKDGALVCLHDRTLERTTNVRDVFPDRGPWFAHDFTLAEIQQLDAGSWFGPAFVGTKVPTYDEVLAWANNRIAVLSEVKAPEVYRARGIDVLALCKTAFGRHGLLAASRGTAITLQSFDAPTVRRATQLFGPNVPVALLLEPSDAALVGDRAAIGRIAAVASGIGPEKSIVAAQPEVVAWAHEAGLRITPWTFRAAAIGLFESVGAEMAHFLTEFGVDAVITDHPDGGRDTSPNGSIA